jgi:hypothetical protein
VRIQVQGGQQEATGGTVIYTTVTDTLMATSYDLQFRSSAVEGAFSAPTYVLCARRRGRAPSNSEVVGRWADARPPGR